jgi:hypothetical protein
MFRKVIGRLFDQRMRDHDHVIDVFLRHNAEVRRRIRPDRLLGLRGSRRAGSRSVAFSGSPVSSDADAEDEHDRGVRRHAATLRLARTRRSRSLGAVFSSQIWSGLPHARGVDPLTLPGRVRGERPQHRIKRMSMRARRPRGNPFARGHRASRSALAASVLAAGRRLAGATPGTLPASARSIVPGTRGTGGLGLIVNERASSALDRRCHGRWRRRYAHEQKPAGAVVRARTSSPQTPEIRSPR